MQTIGLRPFVSAIVLAAASLAAHAETVTLPAAYIGWYNEFGMHVANNINTYTGVSGEEGFRSFYLFDVPALNGHITSARIEFKIVDQAGALGEHKQRGRIFDMKRKALPVVPVEDGKGHGIEIYQDLGTGATYGLVDVPPYQGVDTWAVAPLNDKAMAGITAAQGGRFGVGMVNVSQPVRNNEGFRFSTVGVPGEQNLVLEVAPD